MFTRKDDVPLNVSGDTTAISSIIAKEMQLTGEIQFKGKARLDGLINGNVTGEYLIVSETGRINGDLQIETLICYGSILGNIKAGSVTAHAASFIQGRLETSNLTVESGAALDGEIKTGSRNGQQQDDRYLSAESSAIAASTSS